MTFGLTPRRDAKSRSIWIFSCGLASCRSLATSSRPEIVFSLASTLGAHCCSSSKSMSCRVYWYSGLGQPAADPNGLQRLQEGLDAGHLGELRPQPFDDLSLGLLALFRGFRLM